MYRDEIQAFVETFLRREKRDRMRYLLGNPRKRRAGLDRFCHETMDLIDPEKILKARISNAGTNSGVFSLLTAPP